MSRKIPNKPFTSSSEAKPSEAPKKKTTSPASTPSSKQAAPAPTPVVTPSGSTYSSGFKFIWLLVIIAMGGAFGYYGVPAIRNEISPVAADRVSFNDTILNYEVGATGRLAVSVQGQYSRNDVRWTSSDLSIVDIDQGGNIFAKAPGTVIIRAFVGDGSVQDTLIINVSPRE
jgi:uncharacterized protein YjdB